MGTGKSQLGPDAARRPAGEGEANRDATDFISVKRRDRLGGLLRDYECAA